jgi:stage II sporulation protein D
MEPDIRVRIARGAAALTIDPPLGLPPGEVKWVTVSARPRGAVWQLPLPVKVGMGAEGLELTGADGVPARLGSGDTARVVPAGPRFGVRIGSSTYTGTLDLVPRTDTSAGVFDAVVELAMESYLPGVVSRELYANWPKETFRAQAIAARSYAMHERERSRRLRRHYDLENTAASQVFGGDTALEVAHTAVETTRGRVLTWDGQVLRAYYSSTHGGRPAAARDVFPTAAGWEFNLAPPIQASPRVLSEQTSPVQAWTVTRRVEDLSGRIRAWGAQAAHPVRGLGVVTACRLIAVNGQDRPTRYELTDVKGARYELSAEELRVASNFVTPTLPEPTRRDRVLSSDLEVVIEAGVATIRGRGFGHGVGMSQWSAYERGLAGLTGEAIVTEAYPGAALERRW